MKNKQVFLPCFQRGKLAQSIRKVISSQQLHGIKVKRRVDGQSGRLTWGGVAVHTCGVLVAEQRVLGVEVAVEPGTTGGGD